MNHFIYLSRKKVLHSYKKNFEHLLMLCDKPWKYWPSVLQKVILKNVSVFSICCFYLPFERTLILYLSKDACAKFCWNRPNGSWEKDRNGKSLLWQRRQWKQRQKFSIRKAHLSLLLRWAKIHTISFNSKSILKSTIMP